MAVAYVKSGSGVTVFAQSTAYSVGSRIVPSRDDTGTNHQLAKRWVWHCTTAGTSAAANPTWPASVTQDATTVTSGTAVFTARRPGFSSGTTADWSFATIYIDYPWGAGGLNAAGDICYVSSSHSESLTGAFATSPGNTIPSNVQIISVNDSAAPPTSALAGAKVSQLIGLNGNIGDGSVYWYGVTFELGGGTCYPYFYGTYDTCTFLFIYSSGNAAPNCGVFINCSVRVSGATATIFSVSKMVGGRMLAPTGTTPTAIMGASAGARSNIIENVDFSALPSNFNFINSSNYLGGMIIRNCKLPPSWTGALNASAGLNFGYVNELNATSADGSTFVYRKQHYGGFVYNETSVVRTGGAFDGSNTLAYRLVTNANARFPIHHVSTPEIVVWNEIFGVSMTATIELIHDSTTDLTNDECWVELSYYGESTSPLGTFVSSAKASPIASSSSLSASTATWVTTGLTNPQKHKISLTFTPMLKGAIIARVYLAKPSKTIYVDPKLVISV